MLAIDGPSASGKGTVAQGVAQALGFRYLDSGALYRVLGLAAARAGIDLDRAHAVLEVLSQAEIAFVGPRVYLDARDVSEAIREEPVSDAASRVSTHAEVRQALLARQRDFRKEPGLVADGRDMGSVVFPDAVLKIYLTASAQTRAQRRYKQLIDKGLDANMTDLLQGITLRDQRDSVRAAAPLQKQPDAIELDTTHLSVNQAIAQVLRYFSECGWRK